MPSSYTVNLGIEKIATGEQSGTWGDTTNVNFDIIDQAVNGAASVTLASAGSSGSPNTLAITDGATSDGRNKFIEFTDGGDLGATAYVQLTPNDAEKIVFIRNSLSGSRSVILFQGTYNAARDVEVPAGVDMIVKFQGGGTVSTVQNVMQRLQTEALDVKGNITVTGTVDGRDVATDGTKLDTVETNADVTDTANVTAAGALMDSELTDIAAVKALNQGVSTTDSPTFAGLTVDTNTLYVDSTNNRVGVGTTSPAQDLHIADSFPVIRLEDTDGTDQYSDIIHSGGNINIDARNGASNGEIRFRGMGGGSTTVYGRFDTSGNFGIGTASPSAELDVAGTGLFSGRLGIGTDLGANPSGADPDADNLVIDAGGADAGITIDTGTTSKGSLFFADGATGDNLKRGQIVYDHNGDYMAFATNASEAVRINSSGNVGIGTTSPSDELVVVGTARIGTGSSTADMKLEGNATPAISVGGSTNAAIISTFGTGGSSGHVGIEVTSNDNNDGFYIATDSDQDGTVDTLAMKINADGDVGLGTSSPDGKLDVRGTVFFPNVNTTALAGTARISPTTGEVLRNTSSIRYKTDVEDASDTISEAVVYGSRPVWYRSLAEADPSEWSFWGFIAEELHEVDPRLVDYAEDENGDLIPDGVQYDRFVVHLVNVAQQQKARIDDLEARLAALEAKL